MLFRQSRLDRGPLALHSTAATAVLSIETDGEIKGVDSAFRPEFSFANMMLKAMTQSSQRYGPKITRFLLHSCMRFSVFQCCTSDVRRLRWRRPTAATGTRKRAQPRQVALVEKPWLALVHGVMHHQTTTAATNSPRAMNSINALPISRARERGAGWDWSVKTQSPPSRCYPCAGHGEDRNCRRQSAAAVLGRARPPSPAGPCPPC